MKRNYNVWSEEERKLFIELYPNHTNEYLLKEVFRNRNNQSLINMSVKLGLKKNWEILKNPKRQEYLKKLKDFYKDNGFTPVSTDLNKYNLPSEVTFRRFFGSYRKACVEAGIPVNISIFGRAKACISSQNDICLSKSELFVTEFLISAGIRFLKERKYKDITGDEITCGNKTCDWFLQDFNVVVEYFGMPEKKSYQARIKQKRRICKSKNIILIELYRKDLKVDVLHKIFQKFLIKQP